MKFLLIFVLACTYKISSLPIEDDRIIFPEEDEADEIPSNIGDLRPDRKSLLNDPNLLKSENTSEDFLFDEYADTKLENGKYFQGDIILKGDQKELLGDTKGDDDPFGTRTGVLWEGYRWPKNRHGKVIVPYSFSNDYTYAQKVQIVNAMRDLMKYTCVQFVPRSTSKDYIYIQSGDGCYSYLGKQGGKQIVSLQRNGCLSRGTIIHELIHALGYDHMQNRSDRDKYVHIIWKNIYATEYDQFEKVSTKSFSNFGTAYDYYSVMHYDAHAFSKNGRPTIIPKNSQYNKVIGQRSSLSAGDAKRINNMYKCYK